MSLSRTCTPPTKRCTTSLRRRRGQHPNATGRGPSTSTGRGRGTAVRSCHSRPPRRGTTAEGTIQMPPPSGCRRSGPLRMAERRAFPPPSSRPGCPSFTVYIPVRVCVLQTPPHWPFIALQKKQRKREPLHFQLDMDMVSNSQPSDFSGRKRGLTAAVAAVVGKKKHDNTTGFSSKPKQPVVGQEVGIAPEICFRKVLQHLGTRPMAACCPLRRLGSRTDSNLSLLPFSPLVGSHKKAGRLFGFLGPCLADKNNN